MEDVASWLVVGWLLAGCLPQVERRHGGVRRLLRPTLAGLNRAPPSSPHQHEPAHATCQDAANGACADTRHHRTATHRSAPPNSPALRLPCRLPRSDAEPGGARWLGAGPIAASWLVISLAGVQEAKGGEARWCPASEGRSPATQAARPRSVQASKQANQPATPTKKSPSASPDRLSFNTRANSAQISAS
jgi:septal ring-binding cell division protein DamX